MNRIVLSLILIMGIVNLYSQAEKQNPQLDKIDILHYDFDIKLSDKSDLIVVTARVSLKFKQNIQSFYLDLKNKEGEKGMIVSSAMQENEILNYRQENDKLYMTGNWKKEEEATIEIKYSGIPADGLVISKNKLGKRTFFGDNWPNRAHNWLSVVDHLSDKASVDFIVRAPQHYDVIANGVLVEKKKLDSGYNYYHYSTKDIPLATKVMVIGVADFDIKQYGEVYGIPISSWVFHPAPKGGLDDYLSAMEVMNYYIDSIGEYSYLKLANVQSKTRYGGMENAGNIFYYENSVNGKHQVEPLIAHEVAHQWFGNSATEKSWYDIWLSEGFATYLTDMYLEYKYGTERMKERMTTERAKVIRYNSRVSKPVIDTTVIDWNRLLNPNSYEKGAWFLHMLRNKIGKENFYKLLRTYYKKYRNSNATTGDFRAIAESVSGMRLENFFDQWLRKPGYPKLDIVWKIKDDILYVNVRQNNGVFDIDLPIRLSNFNRKKIDYHLSVKATDELFALLIDKEFSDQNTKFEVDPNIVVLQETNVKQDSEFKIGIPVIESGALLKEGDLLFQDLDCGALCEAIESVTFGIDSAHFSHVGIVSKIKGDKVTVLEAMGYKVREVSLDDFLDRYKDRNGRPKVVVGRLKDDKFVKNALISLKKYIGKPYDDVFDINNDNYYCSELVYFAFKDNAGKNLFTLMPMSYKNSKTGKYFESWVDYFNKLNTSIPQGKLGINPGGISRSDKINILYKFGNPEGW